MSYHTTQDYSIREKFNVPFWNTKLHNVVHFCCEARIEEKPQKRSLCGAEETILHVVLKSQQVISCGSWRATLAHAEITEITAALTVKYSWGCLIVCCQAPILAQTFRWGPVYSSGLQLFMTGIVYKRISPQIYVSKNCLVV